MLKKLLKHEWKATYRGLLTVHLALLVLSLIGAGTLNALQSGSVSDSVWGFYLVVFALMIFVSVIVTHALLIVRYYRNLFTAEGYLTNTLPVTAGAQLLCKLLNYLIWAVLNILCIIAAFLLLEPKASGKVILDLFGALPELAGSYGLSLTLCAILTVILAVLVSLAVTILLFYVCISLGSLFSVHKVLASVLIFLGLYLLQQMISLPGITVLSIPISSLPLTLNGSELSVQAANLTQFCQLLWVYILVEAVIASIYFAVSRYILHRKLNLP